MKWNLLRGLIGVVAVVWLMAAPVFGQTENARVQGSSLQSVGGVSPFSLLNFEQNLSQYDDINLTQGNLGFSETDLEIPGLGNMGVSIKREYNSQRIKATGDTGMYGWSPYGGNGWSFNIGMRAIVYDPGGAIRVMLQMGHHQEEFKHSYDASTNTWGYRPVMPNGKGHMVVADDFSEIILIREGLKYVFKQKVLRFNSYDKNGGRLVKAHGYDISYIEDGNGNRVTYHYTSTTLNPLGWMVKEAKLSGNTARVLELIGGKLIGVPLTVFLESELSANHEVTFEWSRHQVGKITDSLNREITFEYTVNAQKEPRVSKINYKNVYGNTKSIYYSYGATGELTTVHTPGLPVRRYGYLAYTVTLPYNAGFDTYSPYPNGNYLNSRRVGDTTEIRYGWAPRLVSQRDKTIDANMNGRFYNVDGTACLPVVNKKEVEDLVSREVSGYKIRYNSSKMYSPAMFEVYESVWYQPSYDPPEYTFPTADTSKKRYAFTQASVESISGKEPKKTFEFQEGALVKMSQGLYTMEQSWDFGKIRITGTKNYKSNTLQSEIQIESFDAYNNPTSIRQKSGPIDTRKTMVYSTLSAHVNAGIVSLPVQESMIDLTSNQRRSSYVVYNDKGAPTEIYEGESTAGKKLKTLTYDSLGRVTSETSYGPWGQTTATTVYEALSTVYRVTQTVNGKSGVSEHSPYTGHLLKQTDANGLVVSHGYDSYGRLIKTVNPDGTEKNIAYSVDVKTTTVTALGLSSATLMDGFGRVVLIDKPTGLQDEKFEYYYAGLPSKVYRQENGVWVLKKSYTYDSYLRKTSTTSPDFGTTTYAYDTPQRNAMTVTDSQGRKTIQYQNEAGQTTKQNFSATGVSEDTVFSYNGFGQLLQTTDARGLTHSATYDNYGRLLQGNHVNSTGKRSEPIYSSAGAGIVTGTNIYDRAGALYRSYRYDYDNEGRITALKVDTMTKETTVYDTATNAKGMVASVENADAKTEYKYDTLGRLIEEKTTVKAANNRAMAIGYGYNSESALASISYPDGESIKYGYDTLKRVNAVSYGSTNKSIAGYTYNENGTIKSMQYGNGVKIAYTYERNMLLTKIMVTNAQNAVLYNQDYRYDTPGKMTSTQHSNYFGGYAASHPSANVKRDYSYTAKDELATVTLWSQPKYRYIYDANGNTKRYETAQNNGYTADNMVIDTNEDKILQKTNKDGTRTGYSYDAMGNLNVKIQYAAGASGAPGGVSGATAPESPLPAGVSQRDNYVYNYQDQLSEVHRNGSKIASYGYDTKRQRIYRQVYQPGSEGSGASGGTGMPGGSGGVAPGNTSFLLPEAALREAKNGRLYMWDSAGRSIGEAEATTGRIVVRYIYSGNEKIAMERVDAQSGARSWYYFINNAQGTPVLILDESGGTISRLNLDEWGNVGQLIGPASEVNYTGKKMDPETGLYYFNQRYYDPSLGRFLTEDPAGQGLNPYAYAGNSPLMYVDPDGEFFFLAPLIGAMVTGAVYGAATNVIINVAIAAATGGNIFDAAVSGAINGAIGGAFSGGVGFGIGAIGSSLSGAVGMSGQWVSAMNGLNTAMTTVQAYNIGQGVYEGARTGNWGQFAGAAAQGALMGLDSMGMNPIADFARGVGRSAAGLVDPRFGYKNHIITESSNSDGKRLYQENHFDDIDLSSAKNLSEELALQEAMGKGRVEMDTLNDPKYKGMEKWKHTHRSLTGSDIPVHFVRDPNTGIIHHVKIKRN